MDLKTTAQCALLSALAYEKKREEIRALYGKHLRGFTISFRDLPGEVEYLVAEDDKRVIYAFSGTESRRDLFRDLNAAFVKFGPCFVHNGFGKASESFSKYFDRYMEKKQIILTGHSMGGGVAGCIFSCNLWPLAKCITFGQPKYLKKDHCNVLDDVFFTRVIQGSDFIVRQPSLPDYDHIGQVLYIANNGKLHENPSKWFMFRDRLFAWPWERLTDHSSAGYLESLARYLEE